MFKNCGVEATNKDVKLSKCGDCSRIKYCSRSCQVDDRTTHRPLCKAIIKEKKRLAFETKERTVAEVSTIKSSDNTLLGLHFVRAALDGDLGLVRRLLKTMKKKISSFDINSLYVLKNEKDDNFFKGSKIEMTFGEESQSLIGNNKDDKDSRSSQSTPLSTTALWIACTANRMKVVVYLLKQKSIDVNKPIEMPGGLIPSGIFSTPLESASLNGHVQIVDRLLKSSAININQITACGGNALVAACMYGHLDVVDRLLLETDIDMNGFFNNLKWRPGNEHRGFRMKNALMFASMCGHMDVVKRMLCEKNLAINSKNQHGASALHLALSNQQHEIAKLLRSSGWTGAPTGQIMEVSKKNSDDFYFF